ncbi:hypothetical protein [Paenibacillus hexagrammi]|uniref:DUF5590 domain-containing protein n=1 Tax=Paenibacillus hexagrammi TaxID=2908839 RepID=A0ABY3SI17_9BACL|nr:hypothetical protein [Paenibacillus sp. YPD9-1]UJF32871.1 hypothetical protein L0M14_25380 [Paenibacillus sp. YPD9-1]
MKRWIIGIICLFVVLGGIYIVNSKRTFTVDEVKSVLAKMDLEPIKIRYSMNYAHNERPWLVLAKHKITQKEFVIIIYSDGTIESTELGTTNGDLSYSEMLDIAKSYANNDTGFVDNNLSLEVTTDKLVYWTLPINGSSGEYLYFTLKGDQMKNTPH